MSEPASSSSGDGRATFRFLKSCKIKQLHASIVKISSLIYQPVATQKNHINETVLLSNQIQCLNKWIRKYSSVHMYNTIMEPRVAKPRWLIIYSG